MSYTVGAEGATKSEAADAIRAKLHGVLDTQPEHEADIKTACMAAAHLIDQVQPGEGQNIRITASGSISREGVGTDTVRMTAASLNMNVSVFTPEAPKNAPQDTTPAT
jgi:hypothetical protein